MTKRAGASVEPDIAKLNAALVEAERLIRAVRSMIQKTPSLLPESGPGGGRPCRSLIKAQGKVRAAKPGIVGPKPCTEAQGEVRKAELGIVGPKPCDIQGASPAKRR